MPHGRKTRTLSLKLWIMWIILAGVASLNWDQGNGRKETLRVHAHSTDSVSSWTQTEVGGNLYLASG